MLTVSGLSKSHGARTLFTDVTFRLSPGRRIALVGANGVGKTTILEIVMGLQHPDSGEVSRPKDYRIGYLPQELTETWTDTVLHEVMRGAGDLLALEAELRELETRMGETGPDHDRVVERYGEIQSRYETMGGYQIEADARRILGGLGFTTADMDRPLKEMSGGWQMRAVLARLLLQEPDVLVLDEPTNHLDVDSVAWLEQQLAAWPGSMLFVSHDRDFIDAVAERVVEIAWGTSSEYIGGFAEFVVAREERLASLEAAAGRQAKEIERVERFIERFRYKATKSRQVQSRIKTLEKLDRIEVPKVDDLKLKFAFPEPPRSSRLVIEIDSAAMGYDDGVPVLTGVDLVVERGQKLALVGPNGAGKSTLLRTIMGQLEPLAGTSKLGANVDVAYFAQHHVDALDLNRTVEQEFRHKVGAQPKNRNIRTVLGSFGFSGEAADRLVGDLSGGERTRLALAETMCNPVNLLILDEPTNHLDLPSCDVLEDALRAYPGTVLLVSHDRYLIRNTMEELVVVRDGVVTHHDEVDEAVLTPGTPVLAARSTAKTDKADKAGTGGKAGKAGKGDKGADKAASSSGGGGSKRRKQRHQEAEQRNAKGRDTRDLRRRVNRLEDKAGKAENEARELEVQLAAPEVYADKDKMNQLIDRHETARRRADRLLAEWEEASTALERAEAGS